MPTLHQSSLYDSVDEKPTQNIEKPGNSDLTTTAMFKLHPHLKEDLHHQGGNGMIIERFHIQIGTKPLPALQLLL